MMDLVLRAGTLTLSRRRVVGVRVGVWVVSDINYMIIHIVFLHLLYNVRECKEKAVSRVSEDFH